MPNFDVSYVLEIHKQLLIDSFQIGNICSVSEDDYSKKIFKINTSHGFLVLFLIYMRCMNQSL